MNKNNPRAILLLLKMVAASFALAACGGKVDTGAAPGATAAGGPASSARAMAGAPISITTAVARQRDFDVTLEAVGIVAAMTSVEVKPQINSVVTRVHVKEGQFVKAGDLLFTLDPRPDEANLAKIRAQMVKDEAVLADAQRQLARSRDLFLKSFISQGALDSSQAQVDAQLANLVADRAAVEAAQLALSYSTVRAPSAGRLGAINVFPGTAVQVNQTSLVTVTQLDPINISFNLPQRNLEAVLNGLKFGGSVVSAKLPDAKVDYIGRLQFVDNLVDAATGTIKVKAVFDNRDARFWPGAFVHVALVSSTLKDALVVPTIAIIQSMRGPVVYVVDKDKAVLRSVKVLAAQGDESVVTGVVPGDRVVLEGRQNLRPNSSVVERPHSVSTPARPTASSAS